MNAVDTNILFYAHDSREPEKQSIASELIATLDDGALLWQVACEYLWASRKLEGLGYSYSDAFDDIRDLRRVWRTVLPDWTDLDRMDMLKGRFGLSFWDALLVGSCLQSGVRQLFSEDFGYHTSIDSLGIVNPFS